jgi:hypothetical protein
MPTLSRAHEIASIHLGGINASRKKCGLPPLAASELALEFADADRAPFRKAVAPRATPNTGAADSMWGSIVQKLNMTVPSSRTPIAAGRTSPANTQPTERAVNWASIARNLNDEAGLATPGRSAR